MLASFFFLRSQNHLLTNVDTISFRYLFEIFQALSNICGEKLKSELIMNLQYHFKDCYPFKTRIYLSRSEIANLHSYTFFSFKFTCWIIASSLWSCILRTSYFLEEAEYELCGFWFLPMFVEWLEVI